MGAVEWWRLVASLVGMTASLMSCEGFSVFDHPGSMKGPSHRSRSFDFVGLLFARVGEAGDLRRAQPFVGGPWGSSYLSVDVFASGVHHDWPPECIAGGGITIVPQGRRVFGSLTVGETLELAYRDRGGEAKVGQIYDTFPILKDRVSKSSRLLSGGQQQMLATARGLRNGRLIIMDQPTEGLVPKRVELVGQVVSELKERNATVLLVGQRVKFALAHAEGIDIMSRGVVVRTDSTELQADPETISRYDAVA